MLAAIFLVKFAFMEQPLKFDSLPAHYEAGCWYTGLNNEEKAYCLIRWYSIMVSILHCHCKDLGSIPSITVKKSQIKKIRWCNGIIQAFEAWDLSSNLGRIIKRRCSVIGSTKVCDTFSPGSIPGTVIQINIILAQRL